MLLSLIEQMSKKRLISLLQQWGFTYHGIKHAQGGDELIYVRDFSPKVDLNSPNLTFPYFSRHTRKFVVPIYPEYHTELLPDSILRTESPIDFIESRPNRNAINKVYISRSLERNLQSGDIIIFYRTKTQEGSAYYTSVTTTVGIVQKVVNNIPNLETFINLCKKRSVFSDSELAKHWNFNPKYRPFVVDFLYVLSFPKRLNLKSLKELNIIQEAPRGFEELNDQAFQTLMENSDADQRLIVD
jgi:hypothetical protein